MTCLARTNFCFAATVASHTAVQHVSSPAQSSRPRPGLEYAGELFLAICGCSSVGGRTRDSKTAACYPVARPESPPLGFVQPAPGSTHVQAAVGALPGPRGPWPAKRIDKSSVMVAAPGMFILLAVLTDW
jgi:hypothetical protein